jgi:hypothetical protein
MIEHRETIRIAHALGKHRDDVVAEYGEDDQMVQATDEVVELLWEELVRQNPQLRQDNLNTNISFQYAYKDAASFNLP